MLEHSSQSPVPHGGDLWRAIRQYGGTPAAWLDLSTGINPTAYPVPPLPEDIWRCLPHDDDGLNEIARQYYGLSERVPMLAVPGSQYAIRQLPSLLPPGTVGIAELSYGEYAPAFLRAGHRVVRYRYPGTADPADPGGPASDADTTHFTLHADQPLPDALRYLVVVNPNNPTTHRCSTESLLKWRAILHARGGMLIVDEAFADVEPSSSLPPGHTCHGLIVLRSVGKFFGLAGIRAGFVIGPADVLDALNRQMGAWAVSGPARYAMRHALSDIAWQTAMRVRLATQRARMQMMLAKHQLHGSATPLFIWLPHPNANHLQQHLAQSLIWTRLFGPHAASLGHPSLRLGMPADAADVDRIDHALAALPPT